MTTVDLGPGIHDIPADDYHRDPVPGGSLSSTGARKLLPPSCPALYRHWRDNPQPSSDAFDLGKVVHGLVLGVGALPWVVGAPDWRTKAAREQRDEAVSKGFTPLLKTDYDRADAMYWAVRNHPLGSALFSDGLPERTLIWRDEPTGVMCRAMLDYLREPNLIVDLKTCQSAHPDAIAKSVANYGYHIQQAHYLNGARAVGVDNPRFVFVFVEKTPPHLVTVAQLDAEAAAAGEQLTRRALEVYRDCAAADVWPGYAVDDIPTISLPRYALRTLEETW